MLVTLESPTTSYVLILPILFVSTVSTGSEIEDVNLVLSMNPHHECSMYIAHVFIKGLNIRSLVYISGVSDFSRFQII